MSNNELIITVNTGDYERINKPVEVQLDASIFDSKEKYINVVEVDAEGTVKQDAIVFQIESDWDGKSELTFLMSGTTPAHCTRHFRLFLDDKPASNDSQISLTDGQIYQEQESYEIKTDSATYYYHKFGGGFASMIDRDGNDWLSYRPFGGSDGKYRGIPNIAHPENYFHPGGIGGTSRIVSKGALKVSIYSESDDGKWACEWDIFSTYAQLTILRVGHPYWLLYEGTPGGKLDEEGDYSVRSNGVRLPLTERWTEAMPAPEWIYFGSSNTERVLYLVHHEPDEHIDSYWSMEHNMTVFGFGRDGLQKFMTATPAHFTIGFSEQNDFDLAQKVINSAYQPLHIRLIESSL